jgi:CheY-like chemotaxis protein
MIRMLIVDVLAEAGYTALEAGDGPSGLRILDSDARIDLLITQRQYQEAELAHKQALAVAEHGSSIDLTPFVDAKTKAMEKQTEAKTKYEAAGGH